MNQQLTELLTASSPILIAVAMTVLGKVLKITPWFPDKAIPIALCVAGSVGYMGIETFTYRNGVLGFVIGGMAAVGANQLWRQLFPPEPSPTVAVNVSTPEPKPEKQPLNPL